MIQTDPFLRHGADLQITAICIVAIGIRTDGWAAEEPAPLATVSLRIVEEGATEPLPCRVHIFDTDDKPVKVEAYPFWHDHFVFGGRGEVKLPAGEYRCEIERGPEYTAAKRSLIARSGETIKVEETLRRIVDLAREGWWSGETHIHRPDADVPLLMRADDLHVGVAITWWNDRNAWKGRSPPAQPIQSFDGDCFLDRMGGEDERGGGALLFTHLREPLAIAGSKREWPSSAKWLAEGKSAGAWVDAEKPFWRDYPLWLASGKLDSVGLANNHMNRSRMLDNEAWGRPRDRELFAGPHGNGHWTQALYYQTLNCGFRLPPSAGSASGVLPNPVGYNRVYAQLDGELTWNKWWDALRAGRVFVTNGPMLRLKANGKLPGHAFRPDGPIEITIDGLLDSRDPIASVELVRNGRIETIRLPATVKLDQSGWFLVRAIADVPHTFRFASTGPWYVDITGQPRHISRGACAFFLRWIDERIEQLRQAPMSDEDRIEVLRFHQQARDDWTALYERATRP